MQPCERQREHAQHARERADRAVAFAEQRHPSVEEEVVQRRMPIVAQRTRDVAERQSSDVDAQRLVEPKV
jgi:hypothetical protein